MARRKTSSAFFNCRQVGIGALKVEKGRLSLWRDTVWKASIPEIGSRSANLILDQISHHSIQQQGFVLY